MDSVTLQSHLEESPVEGNAQLFEDTPSALSNSSSLSCFEDKRLSLSMPRGAELRGTSTSTVLGGFGRRLRSTVGAHVYEGVIEDDYDNSYEVDELSYFLSHSWRAQWWKKYFTLLLFYNTLPALAVTLLVMFASCMVLHFVLPDLENSFTDILCRFECLIFFVVLQTFHHFEGWVTRFARAIFLDKVCIHQKDPELKELGIRSIGGILQSSRKLLIAWDSTYFDRLWCTFEVAAWLLQNLYAEKQKPIVLVPIEEGVAVILLALGYGITDIFASFMPQHHWSISISYGVSCSMVAACHRRYINSLRLLKHQLQTFSIEKAHCYCCSNDHIHPETGASLPCDRKLVYEFIEKWLRSTKGQEGSLRHFNRLVQGPFALSIKKCLTAHFPYRYAVCISLFAYARRLDLTRNVIYEDEWWNGFARRMLESWHLLFVRNPMLIGLLMSLVHFFLSRAPTRRTRFAYVGAVFMGIFVAPCLLHAFGRYYCYWERYVFFHADVPHAVRIPYALAEIYVNFIIIWRREDLRFWREPERSPLHRRLNTRSTTMTWAPSDGAAMTTMCQPDCEIELTENLH